MDTTNNVQDTIASDDDTSTSAVVTSLNSYSLNVESTIPRYDDSFPAMTDDYPLDISLAEEPRKFFKRMLKLSIYYLQHDAFKLVCVDNMKTFLANSLDFKKPDDKEFDNIDNKTRERTTCIVIDHACAAADELNSHNHHMWTFLDQIELGKKPWSRADFWKSAEESCHSKQNLSFVTDDEKNSLPNISQRSYYFTMNIGKPCVLYTIFLWIMNSDMMTQVVEIHNGTLKHKNFVISLPMMAFFLEFAIYLHQQCLGSRYHNTNKLRDFELPKKVIDWLTDSYINLKGVMQTLVFNAYNHKNDKLSDILTNGIDKSMDCKVKLKKFAHDNDAYRCIIYHMVMMRIKFLAFYPILCHSINAVWFYDKISVHLPMQLVWNTTETLLHAMYYFPSQEKYDVKIDDKYRNYLDDSISDTPATTDERRVWKVKQGIQFLHYNWSLLKQKTSKLLCGVFNLNENHHFFILPYTGAFGLAANSYIKGPSQPLFDIISRNKTDFNLAKTKSDSEKLNREWCSSKQYYKYLGLNAADIQKVRCDLLSVMKYAASEWPANTHGTIPSGATQQYSETTFERVQYFFTTQPWKSNGKCLDKGKRYLGLESVGKYYGNNWLIRSHRQYEIRQSVEYSTLVQIMKKRYKKVADYGIFRHGKKWNPVDCDSEKEITLSSDSDSDSNNTKSSNQNNNNNCNNNNNTKSSSGLTKDFFKSDGDSSDSDFDVQQLTKSTANQTNKSTPTQKSNDHFANLNDVYSAPEHNNIYSTSASSISKRTNSKNSCAVQLSVTKKTKNPKPKSKQNNKVKQETSNKRRRKIQSRRKQSSAVVPKTTVDNRPSFLQNTPIPDMEPSPSKKRKLNQPRSKRN